jgi:hypothetical protein
MKNDDNLIFDKMILVDFLVAAFHELDKGKAPQITLKQAMEFIDKWVEEHFKYDN